MSIGSILTSALQNPFTQSVTSQSLTEASWSTTTGGAAGTAASPSDPFQNLASDIQAMLIQAQNSAAASSGSTTSGTTATGTTPTASGTSATGTTTAVTPEQQLATDLQTLMSDLQSATSANPQTAGQQTASTNPTDPTTDPVGQTEHHHHHHHHEGSGEASGASAVASSSSSSGTTAAAGATTAAGARDDAAVSQIFASDITQALAAYGGGTSSAMMPGLIV